MSKKSDPVRAEAALMISKAIQKGAIQTIDLYVDRLIRKHPNISGEDTEWYKYCAYGHARSVVRDILMSSKKKKNKIKEVVEEVSDASAADGAEFDDEVGKILDDLRPVGFSQLQLAYDIVRDGKRVLVSVLQLTPQECREKARELRSFSNGALAHADELDRYADQLEEAAQ